MDLETAQNTTTAKLPILKQATQTTTNVNDTLTTLIPGPVTTEEKVQKKNNVKVRSMLLMALSNKHLMTFNQYKDAKTLFAVIQTRFGGNEATEKTQKTLLKQMYKNFSALSTESLDSIWNRLQKFISQPAILGENILQKDLNMKFLRSLPFEWNTHVVVWKNKPDLNTMSFDDLYNNFKIVEQETSNSASEDFSNEVKKSLDASLVKQLVSDDKLEKKTFFPTAAKIDFVRPKQQEKPVMKPVKYVEMYRPKTVNTTRPNSAVVNAVRANQGNPHLELQEKGVNDNGCSRHMTRNMSYLSKYEEIDGGYVAFGGDPKGGGLICLFAKATLDESNLWHRMLRHINFKTMNKLFCEEKGIKKEFSVSRTPQQNVVVERNNRTLIEAARTMLADSKLPTIFWAKAVNTACYVQNRVLVINPHNKTPYELFHGRTLSLSFMRPFWCPDTILNTLDHLGKFDGKADDRFFAGYSMNNKAFRVFNSRNRILEETLHITFLKNKPNVAGNGPTWLFNIDTLIKSMNYKLVIAENQSNGSTSKDRVETEEEKKDAKDIRNEDYEVLSIQKPRVNQEKDTNVNSTNNINNVSPSDNAAGIKDNVVDKDRVYGCADDPNMPNLEEINHSDDDEDVGAEADMTNLNFNIPVNPIPTTKIHKDHPVEQIIGDIHSAPQTRRMTNNVTNYSMFSLVQQRVNHKNFQNCLFACFLSQVEPRKTLVDLPYGKRAIGTKWINKNKKDKRGIVVRNKARSEAIELFLTYASFKDFVVYQMDVKSAYMYGKIKEEVYVCQPPRFEDPQFPDRVHKVEKAVYGLHQTPRAWKEMCTEFEKMMHKKFQMSSMGELAFFLGLQVTQKDGGIFISQDKYVDEILKKFGFLTVKTTSTPMETSKPLMKDGNAEDVDVHLYRSMIGLLIIFRYLKGQPKLGLWYPKDFSFKLEAYTDSDNAGASLDMKSTTGGYQFLRSILISWQCKKQTVVANSTTETEYVAASDCCGQQIINDD
nr:hypothetical protein [Tanacetum cinerariifolium]